MSRYNCSKTLCNCILNSGKKPRNAERGNEEHAEILLRCSQPPANGLWPPRGKHISLWDLCFWIARLGLQATYTRPETWRLFVGPPEVYLGCADYCDEWWSSQPQMVMLFYPASPSKSPVHWFIFCLKNSRFQLLRSKVKWNFTRCWIQEFS